MVYLQLLWAPEAQACNFPVKRNFTQLFQEKYICVNLAVDIRDALEKENTLPDMGVVT